VGWGGECVTPVLVRSLKLSTLVHSQFLDWCPRVRFPYSTQTRGFKNNWSRHLVKQLWPPDGCRRTEGRLSKTLLNKKEVLSGLIQVKDDEERKGGKADCVYGCRLKVPGGIQSGLTNDWEQWVLSFSVRWHLGLIPEYQKNSCPLLFSGLRSSWNLINPILRMNVAWMDECAAQR